MLFSTDSRFRNHSKWYEYSAPTLEFSNQKSTFQLLRGRNRRWEVSESFENILKSSADKFGTF